jgi:hypothetical protein
VSDAGTPESIVRIAVVLSAALVFPFAVNAQQSALATLEGRVLDATDSGSIAWADVQIVGANLIVRADGRGNYRLTGIPGSAKEFSVRALGYARLTQSEEFLPGATLRRDIYMMRIPHTLSQIRVQGRSLRVPRSFEQIYERGTRGFGTFITREQIDSLNPFDLKTMFTTVPGVYTNTRGVYFHKCSGGSLGQLWIDGQRVTRFAKQQYGGRPSSDPYFFNELLEQVRPTSVQAIEIYPTRVFIPAEFLDGNPCAVIAIWTKRGT